MSARRHGAPSDNTFVRDSRKIFRQNKGATPPVLQEPTPDDSAAEDAEMTTSIANVADHKSAKLQVLMENTDATPPSPAPATESEAQDHDTRHVVTPNSNNSNVEFLKPDRPRVTVVIQQASRTRRSHGRPTYIEHLLSDSSEQESETNGHETDDEDDVWDLPASEDESEVDESGEFSTAVESSSDGAEDTEDLEAIEIDTEPVTTSRRKSNVTVPKHNKGLDLSLPPIDTIRDAVADMASRAVGLGLGDVLERLKGRTINVATMCSGTESPLIFLEMLQETLDSKGEAPLMYKHHFSAEIDATKQAYIERNFHPSIIFRDVRQLGDTTATTATTAYGAEEPIPGHMDIVIVGFVCKDLSSMNSKKKSVDDQGETGDTWRAVYFYAKRFQPGIVLLENVKADKRLWDDVVSRWRRIGYEASWIYADTKNHILPQTRERMYMIAINCRLYGEGVSEAVDQWRCTMEKMQRQCSSSYEAWLANLPVSVTEHSTLSSEPDWSLCKLRYDQIRSQQRLGTRRPVTKWNESGTLQ